MSDNYNLIIKNGSCYIGGKLQNVDLALSGNKIKKIGKTDLKKFSTPTCLDPLKAFKGF